MSAPNPSNSNPSGNGSADPPWMSSSPSDADAPADPAPAKPAGKYVPRKPLLAADDAKATQLGIRPVVVAASTPAPTRPSNLRRSSHALQLFGVLFVVVLLLFAALLAGIYSFYEKKIQPHLTATQSVRPAAAPPVPAALQIDIPPDTRNEIAATTAKVAELQKQIDALRDASSTIDGRLRELSERMAAAASTAAPAPKIADVPPTLATDGKSDAEVASVVPVTSVTNQELVLLKERNRLTAWADEAIATGNRKMLDLLIKRLTDPEHANLRDAAFAEIQRIYYHLRFTIRIDPGFRIPVNEMFKDAGIRDEADLKTEQLITLLNDAKQEWQVRLRAAWLLGGRRTPEVSESLIKCVKEDAVLDVAKEAQLSLEQNIDRKFLLLDIPAIDAWWKTQGKAAEESAAKPEKKEPAPAKTDKAAKKKSGK